MVLQDTVRQTFGECGDIKSVRFAEDRETGEFRGFGHVEFYDGAHVDAAMALANTDVMGRPIRVSVGYIFMRNLPGDTGSSFYLCFAYLACCVRAQYLLSAF